MKLTDETIQALTKPGRYGDDETRGLMLRVHEGKGGTRRSWVLRLTRDGKRTDVGLGPWPKVSTADARKRASERRAAEAQAKADALKDPAEAAAETPATAADVAKLFAEIRAVRAELARVAVRVEQSRPLPAAGSAVASGRTFADMARERLEMDASGVEPSTAAIYRQVQADYVLPALSGSWTRRWSRCMTWRRRCARSGQTTAPRRTACWRGSSRR